MKTLTHLCWRLYQREKTDETSRTAYTWQRAVQQFLVDILVGMVAEDWEKLWLKIWWDFYSLVAYHVIEEHRNCNVQIEHAPQHRDRHRQCTWHPSHGKKRAFEYLIEDTVYTGLTGRCQRIWLENQKCEALATAFLRYNSDTIMKMLICFRIFRTGGRIWWMPGHKEATTGSNCQSCYIRQPRR